MSNAGSTRSASWSVDDSPARPLHAPQQAANMSHEESSQPIFLPLLNSHQITSNISEVSSIDVSLLPALAACKKFKCPYWITEFSQPGDFNSHVILHSPEEPYGYADSKLYCQGLVGSKQHSSLDTREMPHGSPEPRRRLESGMQLAKSEHTDSEETISKFLDGSTLQGNKLENRLPSKRTKKTSGSTAGLACPFPSTKSSCQVIHYYFSHVW